jgi:hypothetical protein
MIHWFGGSVGVSPRNCEPEPIMGQIVYYARPRAVVLRGEVLEAWAVGIDYQPVLLGEVDVRLSDKRRQGIVRTLILALGVEHRERLRPIP